MRRLVLVLVLPVAALACSGGDGDDGGDAAPRPGPPCGANVVDGEGPGGLLAWSSDDETAVVVDDLDDDAPPLELGDSPRVLDPDLAPDGTQVLWRAGPDPDSDAADIVGVDFAVEGGSRLAITSDPVGNNWGPAFSPDGNRVAFSSTRAAGVPQVWTAGPFGGDVELVTAGHGEYPDWSPDGERLVYAAPGDGGRYDLFTIPARGGDATLLVDDPATDFFPAWSPDGSRIAFHRITDDGGVFVVGADGTGEARVSPDGRAGDPVWAPDGRLGWNGPDGFRVTDLEACTTVRLDVPVGRFPSWVE